MVLGAVALTPCGTLQQPQRCFAMSHRGAAAAAAHGRSRQICQLPTASDIVQGTPIGMAPILSHCRLSWRAAGYQPLSRGLTHDSWLVLYAARRFVPQSYLSAAQFHVDCFCCTPALPIPLKLASIPSHLISSAVLISHYILAPLLPTYHRHNPSASTQPPICWLSLSTRLTSLLSTVFLNTVIPLRISYRHNLSLLQNHKTHLPSWRQVQVLPSRDHWPRFRPKTRAAAPHHSPRTSAFLSCPTITAMDTGSCGQPRSATLPLNSRARRNR